VNAGAALAIKLAADTGRLAVSIRLVMAMAQGDQEATALVRAIEQKAADFTANPAKANRLGYFRGHDLTPAMSGETARPSIHDDYAAWLRAVAERDLAGREYRFDKAPEAPGGIRLILLR
jgi:hypothetical protein